MTNDKLKNSVMNILKEDPQAVDKLGKIIQYVEDRMKQHPGDDYYKSFTWSDVGISPQTLNKWIINDIIKIYYKSNKSTNYLLNDLAITKDTLLEYNEYKIKLEHYDYESRSIEPPHDLFDSILGMEDIKELYHLSLDSDKPVHIVLFGPPATAKSLFLFEVSRLPNAYYAIGSRASGSGISEVLFDKRPDFLLLDEIDKLAKKPSELSVLLSLMEMGVAKDTKHGSIKEIKLNTRVYAAGNVDNLPPELKSRFIPIYLKEYTKDEFVKVVTYFLQNAEKVNPELANYIALELSKTSNDVRMARNIARICKDKYCVDKMINLMKKYRKA